MKFMKPYAATLGSLVLLAMSLPVSAQETTQSTTITQSPDQPVTQTTDSTKTKTKYNRHHHVKETKTKEKTKTTNLPADQQTQTTTITTTPPQQ